MVYSAIARFASLFRRRSLDADAREEIASHFDLSVAAFEQRGVEGAEARRRAALALGGATATLDRQRDARGLPWLEAALQDARFALRAARRNPGYTLTIVLTLGLGIGANTAIFSVIRAVLLRPLPYADGDRLVLVRQSTPLAAQHDPGVSIRELYDYRAQTHGFEHLVEYHQMTFDLLNRGEPSRVSTGVVSHDFFTVLGIRPILGRTFVAADDEPGANAVLVLSYPYWQKKFGGDPAVVGQVFEMNDRPHTVIGVLPDLPQYPQDNDVYMSVSACPFRAAAERTIAANPRAFPALTVFGKLASGVPAAQASAEVRAVSERFARESPRFYPAGNGFTATTLDVRNEMARNARSLLLMLLGATALVLLIACADVANLVLARVLRRRRELDLRASLGASRGRVARQLLTESAILALGGGALGLLVAGSTLGLLTAFVARYTPRASEIRIDGAVLLFTLVSALATGLLVGVLPATRRFGVGGALERSGARTTAAYRWQSALIVAQVSVSVVLLVGAALLLRSFYRLQNVEAGYRADRVLSAEVFNSRGVDAGPNPRPGTITPAAQRAFYQTVLDRLQATPGVASAAITNAVPLRTLQAAPTPYAIDGDVSDPSPPSADIRIVSPLFFDALSVPIVSGRAFADADAADGEQVAIVSRAAARTWKGANPVGSRISFDGGRTWRRVVGVAGDVKQFGLAADTVPQVYYPLAQAPRGIPGARVLARASGNAAALASVIRGIVHDLDPTMPVENVRLLEEFRDMYLAGPLVTALLLSMFAALALVLTLAGIGGVIAMSVSQRTREFGVRMALGATRATVLRGVLGQGVRLVAAGLTIGAIGAFMISRVLTAWLFDTPPTDAVSFAVAAAAILVTGTAACLMPAWRATRVDPMLALRTD
jgi:predicted permease